MMVMPMDFCTYFDSRYLTRGLALYESLCRHAPGSRLHVLCLDCSTFRVLTRLGLPGLVPIKLSDFEAGDEELRAAKESRTLVEYFFTCTPSLPLYVLRSNPELERIFYIDADIYFFSSAAAVLKEWGDGSVYIVRHRFSESLRECERHGKFNVGILGFRNDTEGRRCLEQWRRQCNAWCYDRVEDGKFADQKYLDAWPQSFRGVVVSQHPGVNVAPWNLANYRLESRAGRPYLNGHPLVCYHFHGLKQYRFGLIRPWSMQYGIRLDRDWMRLVYEPYLRQLARMAKALGPDHHGDLRTRGSLSLTDLTVVGGKAQFLLRVGGRWIELSSILLESLRLARRGAARARNLLIQAAHRSPQHSQA